MRLNKVALGLALLAMTVLMVSPVFACEPPLEPGLSPGYWKHQVKVYFTGRGHAHVDGATLESYGIDLVSAYEVFTNPALNHMWLDLANDFNAAAGLAPYNG